VSFETQKAVVWVQNLVSGERRVLANFRGSNSAPAWSPDGASWRSRCRAKAARSCT
jgi:TolB protein